MNHSPGTRLGPYELISLLGAGGMGEVYRARDTRLRRYVAVKMLPAEFAADPERLRRFDQEALATAALNHPNILTVYDSGVVDGAPFVVSELLEGETLREKLTRGALPVGQAVSYARQIVNGLEAAHARGIVHRDLKPDNLFVTADETIKILDFGLAKLQAVQETAAFPIPSTLDGVVLGTPGYMSPEQVRGRTADPRSDIFSFGAVLYEMLAGVRAFTGESIADTFNATLTDDPAPLASSQSEVGAGLNSIVQRCLKKSPKERFQSVPAVRLALDAVEGAAGKASGRQVPALVHELSRGAGARRGRRAVLVAAAMLLLPVALWLYMRPRPHAGNSSNALKDDARRVIAVLPFRNISVDPDQEAFAAGVTEEIRGQLSKINTLHLLSRTAVDPYRNENVRQVAQALGSGSVVEGSVRADHRRVRIAVALVDSQTEQTIWSEQYDRELRDIFAVQSDVAFRVAEALNTTLSPEDRRRVELPPTGNIAAYELYLRTFKLDGASPEQCRKAIGLLQQAVDLDPGFALARARLAYWMLTLVPFDGPRYQQLALQAATEALRIDPTLARAHMARATIYGQMGRVSEARLAFLRALELDPSDDYSMSNLSLLEMEHGRYDESLLWAIRSFRLTPTEPVSYYNVGLPLVMLGEDETSERWLGSAEKRFAWDQGVTDDHRLAGTFRIQILHAMLDAMRGRLADAIVRARRVSAVRAENEEIGGLLAELTYATASPDGEALGERLFRSSPDLTAVWWLNFGSPRVRYAYLLRRQEPDRARQLGDESLALGEKAFQEGNQSPRVPLEIACVHCLRGETGPALDWLERAFESGMRDYRTLAVNPLFQTLHSEERFQKLIGRMSSDVAAMRNRVNLIATLPTPPVAEPSGDRSQLR